MLKTFCASEIVAVLQILGEKTLKFSTNRSPNQPEEVRFCNAATEARARASLIIIAAASMAC